MKDNIIRREHGYGGEKTREIIEEIILPEISNDYADKMDDSAVVPMEGKEILYTTDGYVVNPLFFPGGDIGKLSVSGTVNDILAQGGKPLYISISMIIEEGFKIKELKKIIISTSKEAEKAGVRIVCGDLKVVEKGNADGLFITSSGIGQKILQLEDKKIIKGDKIILTGGIGEHGAAIFQERNNILDYKEKIKSDCACLNDLVQVYDNIGEAIKFLRDPTRGGVAQVLLEISRRFRVEIIIDEEYLPIKEWVKGLTYITGLDPLYLACEGRMIIVAESGKDIEVINELKKAGFKESKVIGKIESNKKEGVYINTVSGGRRMLSSSDIAQIPRIC